MKCFRAGQIWVLICTELMGRGIDFKGVNLVINYDFPPSAISYIHRIGKNLVRIFLSIIFHLKLVTELYRRSVGRTGRAGRTSKAVTFFTEADSVYLRR